MAQPAGQIRDEGAGIVGVALPDQPGRDQLGVGVDGDPGPRVAVLGLLAVGDVALLAPDESPDLIALDPRGRQVAQVAVLVLFLSRRRRGSFATHGSDQSTSAADRRLL